MAPTNTPYKFDHADECTTTVKGETYVVWTDFMRCGMFAMNEAGETRQIKYSGYISKDLTTRKAIAAAFCLDSFRK